MKSKPFAIGQVIILVVAIAITSATASNALPNMTGTAGMNVPQSAAKLAMKPAAPLAPAGTGFTYQGSLKSSGSPANGSYDFRFSLYDALEGGNLISGPITRTTTVTGGLFTANLDFGGGAFDGNARYLQIEVRQSGGPEFSTLNTRQAVRPAPYALFALSSAPYKNVVTVAQGGGQFTAIQSALDSITDASATNRYLVKVGPGIYTEQVTMKQYVDIKGSGQDATKITFSGGDTPTSTLLGASNAELRNLTVAMDGSLETCTAISNNGASPTLLNVTIAAFGDDVIGVTNTNSASPSLTNVAILINSSGGFSTGVSNNNSSPILVNVTINAAGLQMGYGMSNAGTSSPSIAGSSISGAASDPQGSSCGVCSSVATASKVTIDNSRVAGGTNSIINSSTGTTVIGGSRLSGGPALKNGGALTCLGSYDGSNKRLGTNCTRLTKVAIVSVADGDYGSVSAALSDVATWCGSPSTTNRCLVRVGPGIFSEHFTMLQWVDVEGSGEQSTKITSNSSQATVIGANNAELRFLTVENTGSAGATDVIAIYNSGTSPSLVHVAVATSGGSLRNYGLYDTSGSTPMIDSSKIMVPMTSTTIIGGAKVVNSQLSGGPTSGSPNCVGVYDENFTFYANTCP